MDRPSYQTETLKITDRDPMEDFECGEISLLEQTKRHQVEFVKVKGHADDALNNRVDGLAVEAMRLQ